MDKYIAIFIIITLNASFLFGQGFVFGPKGGLSIGQQSIEQSQRDLLFAYHGALYIETLSEENKNALYGQLGYHVRGSAINIRSFINNNGQNVSARQQKFKYGNLSLQAGAKQKFNLGLDAKWYFGFGVRGEYNLHIELPTLYENQESQVNKLLYGVTASIGAEFMFSELVGGLVEFSVHPDLSDQIFLPGVSNGNINIRSKRVRNVSFELSVGLRFLRKVIYVD